MNVHTLDELVFHWRAVIARADSDWAKSFALSIQKACKRRDWHPSPKQLALMQRMVADLFAHNGDDDFSLIEVEGRHAAR